MVFGFFRRWVIPRAANRDLIERFYSEINTAARNPVLFTDYHVEDSFEGRFEMLTLHAAMVLRRLNELPDPGKEIAQDLVDSIFRHFEVALREMGVGDPTVPKRMKTLAEAFLGRCSAYQTVLPEGEAAFSRTLAKNVYAEKENLSKDSAGQPGDAVRLAHYILVTSENFAAASLDALIAAKLPFPSPSVISQ